MVLQEHENPKNCESELCRGSPKKTKPAKIPQRGLGIAALEKLRRDEQQRRAAGGGAAAGISAGGEQLVSASFGNYGFLRQHSYGGNVAAPMAWSDESSSNPNSLFPLLLRKLPESQRNSLVIKNFVSPSSSSDACLLTEPPSNQSYGSMNPPSLPDQQKLGSLKRSWPFQTAAGRPSNVAPGHHVSGSNFLNDHKKVSFSRDDSSCSSTSNFVNDHKRVSFSRDDSSNSSSSRLNFRAEGGVTKLDGSLLSLSLLPVSEPMQFQKHCIQVLKNNEKISESDGPPTFYNFMDLPLDLIGSNLSDVEAESKGERKCRSVK